jgi:hypothetical protein
VRRRSSGQCRTDGEALLQLCSQYADVPLVEGVDLAVESMAVWGETPV